MKLKPLKSKKDYQTYLEWVDKLFDKKVKANSPEGEVLQVALLLIKEYEDRNYFIPVPDPIEAIKLKMTERGLKIKDFW
jgi:HTH-type transcriptional regulator / antitoxin HigA